MKLVTQAAVLGVVALMIEALPASADPIIASIFNNTTYEQTSDSAPTTPAYYFFNMIADEITAGDFDQALATYPGPGSPQSLPSVSPTSFVYGSSDFSSLSTLHAAYPFGTYSVTATNSVTQASTTGNIDYTADYFTSDIPYLTNYSALSGLNPAAPFTITFPSFTPNPNPNINEAFIFLNIYDGNTGLGLFGDYFAAPDTTSFTIAANQLLPNHPYFFELNYDNRIGGPLVNNAYTQQGFDMRTDGSFTTGAAAIPEPATIILLGTGLLGLGLTRRRKTR